MTTKELSYFNGQQSSTRLNTRVLGTLGMLTSPMILIEGLYAGFQQHGTDQFIGLIEVIYMSGWMCSLIGLYLMEVTGQGKIGKALLSIQALGVFIAALWSGYHIFVADPDTSNTFYIATDISWPFSHMFMLVTGTATLVAKRWTDWRRFTPLLCGLALPTAILTSIAVGETALGIVFGLWTMTAFALLGYAVRTGEN